MRELQPEFERPILQNNRFSSYTFGSSLLVIYQEENNKSMTTQKIKHNEIKRKQKNTCFISVVYCCSIYFLFILQFLFDCDNKSLSMFV